MSALDGLERRVADFYATEAPHRAPDRVLVEALATIETTRQRRELRLVPWRVRTMNTYARVAIAAMVVIALGAAGIYLVRPGADSSVGAPGPTTSPTPSGVPSPSPSQLPSAPPLDATFTSTVHGLSIAYPAGWTAVPATESGAPGSGFLAPTGDWLFDPVLRDHLFLVLGSQSLEGEAGAAWAASAFTTPDVDCSVEPEPITIDGQPGLLCDGLALAWTDDRGYHVRLHVSTDEPQNREIFDRAWFEEALASVRLPAAP